ncbi:MAG: sodium:proton antiporter [Acidobacteria bacterium]|nr:sodium:proton antiporter [Acidobacteriota bacterium]NIM63692.1 sodium:proton antiporter [Acidobacteriota bacterium]NIO59295.1 sodium:proton antiporter [Acidobacteriota bacterium]NIQ30307.1 sodium:proton antiporter [Acidobacteriota bacterium]NIQ85250.1 sodium:proton antiporter [Acidobacteriota bacterium]
MALVLDILSWGLLMVGGTFAVIGGVGLVRLPDLFSRMHGAGITDTLGAGSILAGLMLVSWDSLITVKLIAILIFLLLTSPTATHALARSAIAEGIRPWTAGQEDPSSSE